MSILFTPTYLYIKQHSVTGLKYFGKTTKKDPYKYNGSGTHWTRHIKKHGKEHIVTIWIKLFEDKDELVSTALALSEMYDIAVSDGWANLIPENGLDGGIPGLCLHKPAGHGAKVSAALTGKKQPNVSAVQKGKPKSAEHKANISAGKMGKRQPNVSAAMTGKMQRLVTCPHCNTTGGVNTMKRWHFDNCKLINK